MIRKADQLPLGLGHEPAMSRADFVVGNCNRAALAVIDAWPDWPTASVLLVGPEGAGKTHLVAIWAESAGAVALDPNVGAAPPAAGVPLAIENIDRPDLDETALFHALNAAREASASVLLTARGTAFLDGLKLADLRSRLRAAQKAELAAPDDALLKRVLVKLFSDRQLFVSPSLLEYVVTRMERSFGAAAEIVERIDAAALASGRGPTRQVAAEVLAALANDEQPAGTTEAK